MFVLRQGGKQVWDFFTQRMWEVDIRTLSRPRRFVLQQVQVAFLVARNFFQDQCILRASALTYTTLLSIIPMLALMFSVLKGFGVQDTLEPMILERLAVGSEEVFTQIVNYIDNTNVGRLGTIGLVILIFTVLTLLSNIEKSFNHIWGVRETRSLLRRFADYFSVVIFAPLFLFVAISMTATLQTQAFTQKLLGMALVGDLILLLFKTLPYITMWAAFTFLYVFMPNIHVRFRSAFIGGVIGGTLWQFCQWGYVHFQVGVSRYNAIYGTMAVLPILMVWIYLSWLIVLLGVEVAFASQNLRTLRQEISSETLDFATREHLSLGILVLTGEVFHRGDSPLDDEQIALALDLPTRLTLRVISDLTQLGFLAKVEREGQERDCFQPGRSPETLLIDEVLGALRNGGEKNPPSRHLIPENTVVSELMDRLSAARKQTLDGLTLQELVHWMIDIRESVDEGQIHEGADQAAGRR